MSFMTHATLAVATIESFINNDYQKCLHIPYIMHLSIYEQLHAYALVVTPASFSSTKTPIALNGEVDNLSEVRRDSVRLSETQQLVASREASSGRCNEVLTVTSIRRELDDLVFLSVDSMIQLYRPTSSKVDEFSSAIYRIGRGKVEVVMEAGADMTPVKNRLYTMADQLEGLQAEIGVLENENTELRDAAKAPKRKRDGFTVKNMGTHLFSTGAMKEEAYRRKVEQAAKKARKKPEQATGGSQRPQQATAGPSGTSG